MALCKWCVGDDCANYNEDAWGSFKCEACGNWHFSESDDGVIVTDDGEMVVSVTTDDVIQRLTYKRAQS